MQHILTTTSKKSISEMDDDNGCCRDTALPSSRPEIKSGLRPGIFKMLEEQSQHDYLEAIDQFNTTVEKRKNDFKCVIFYSFDVLEGEFVASIIQWMRWEAGILMPENFNKLVEGVEASFKYSHFRPVKLNKKYLNKEDGQYKLQPPTFGDVCRPLIAYIRKTKCHPFPNCLEFLEECRSFATTCNPMRHSHYGSVSFDKAVKILNRLDNILNKSLPKLYIMKLALKGKLGRDIAKALENAKTINNTITFEEYPESAD